MQDEDKLFREVKLLSRLQHRHIVRYYTTWLESPEGDISESSSNPDSEFSTSSHQQKSCDDPFAIDLDELSRHSRGHSTSFPSIHFSRTPSDLSSSSNSDSDDESSSLSPVLSRYTEKAVLSHRILYIQMVCSHHLWRCSGRRVSYFVILGICREANTH